MAAAINALCMRGAEFNRTRYLLAMSGSDTCGWSPHVDDRPFNAAMLEALQQNKNGEKQ